MSKNYSVRGATQLQPVIDYLLPAAVDPFQRYILKKEILRETPDGGAYSAIHTSKWYSQLADEQWENGSWGRFHSMDTRLMNKRKFVSTEAALRRAFDLGLTKADKLIEKCAALMERYLRGEEMWLDYTEKHHDNGKSFLIAFPFLIAANLSRFDPENALLKSKRDVFVKTLEKSFVSGSFEKDVWEQGNREYIGPCLGAWTVYPFWLLQGSDCLDEALQRRYLNYIWNRNEGIHYISKSAPAEKFWLEDKGFTVWLSALESLSGFSLFPEFMRDDVFPHLSGEMYRLMNGGVRLPVARPISGHYAESWREKNARKNDMLLRILRVLVKARSGA